MVIKQNAGNYFEDFDLGQVIRHATPRTVTAGDASVYMALYGSRFPATSSDMFARNLGYPMSPVDDLLSFHIVFGKTVPDISLNAVANLGYADCRFIAPVYVGDTLSSSSEVIGKRELSNGRAGIVYVRSTGRNQRDETVIDYVRWVMVRKRDAASAAPEPAVPDLPASVSADRLSVPDGLDLKNYDFDAAGSAHLWDDYEAGEKIDHVDGMTVEEAEHMMATRLYQNTAKVHFNQYLQNDDRNGRRLVYGGVVISLARALSFNGLANAFKVAAINAGTHTAPCFAGNTVFAWSKILEKADLPGRHDVAALRVQTFATKDCPASDFPEKVDEKTYHEAVILDLDYWVLMPRR